jgi:excisionase family DNA binding protein
VGRDPKPEIRSEDVAPAGERLLNRFELAAALRVSLSTVDRMLANDEIPCMRLRGRVRFHLADVIECLRKGNRKYGRRADLTALTAERGPAGAGNPKPENRDPKGAA